MLDFINLVSFTHLCININRGSVLTSFFFLCSVPHEQDQATAIVADKLFSGAREHLDEIVHCTLCSLCSMISLYLL